ncbi:hypothetical protein ACFQZX_04100 [Mucilaginibacter litoreus]|uniref:Uncharacterized protein n=1 Tax=Mucilaginibacter litoreus TaxID=1048221 RepID=A0ABW3AP25_9SPHI
MHIAYSALRITNKQGKAIPSNKEFQQRYEGYITACSKYRNEIAAIQKYMPGWAPKLEVGG